jgi:hypothetical protein
MPRKFAYAFVDLNLEVSQVFDQTSIPRDGKPTAVIITGPVATGKSTYRRRYRTQGYVVVDAAEIFLSLCCNRYFDFPSNVFRDEVDWVGSRIAKKAIAEGRHLVCELNSLSCTPESLGALLKRFQERGYAVQFEYITVEPEEGWRRNVNRSNDSISSVYTDKYHWAWLYAALSDAGARPEA